MKWFHPILVLFVALAIAGEASAQFGGGGGMRRGGMGGSGGADKGSRPGQPATEVARMSGNDQVRMQLTEVRLALRLSPEQAPSWSAYEDRVLSLLDDLSRGASVPVGGSALQQIESKIDIVRNRLTAMEDLADAAKRLYNGLSGAQRTMADGMLAGTVPTLYTSSMSASAAGRGRPPERPPERQQDRQP